MAGSGSAASAWAPLRIGVFRALWIAPLFSNMGELFTVPSWEEHLRQHRQRQTGTDLQYLDDAAALSDPPPQTDHYLAADVHE